MADVCGGDIRRRGEIGNLEEDERHGGHARRVMAAYEKWLGEGAERGDMRLHLADYHLEAARLALAQGNTVIACNHWQYAADLIERTGYHRRDGEVAELEQQLG